MEIRTIFTIALIVAIGSIVMVQQNATNQTGNQTNSSSIYPSQDAKAEPNCDQADLERNDEGHVRGNAHCDSFPGEDGNPPEPFRDCDKGGQSNAQHKNAFKDNDEDGSATCVLRGNE